MSEKVYLELQDQENWDFQSTDGDVIYTNSISRFEKVKTIIFLQYGESEWSPGFNLSTMELPALDSIFIYKIEIPDSTTNSEVDESKLFDAIDEKSLAKVRMIEIYDCNVEFLPDWMQHCT